MDESVTRTAEEIQDLWPEVKAAVLATYGDKLDKATVIHEVCQFIRRWYAIHGHRVDCTWSMIDSHEMRFTIIPSVIHKVTITGTVAV